VARLERREGGREGGRVRQDLWLPGFWLQAACQLGLFPRPPPTSQPLSPISDGRMVWGRRRRMAS